MDLIVLRSAPRRNAEDGGRENRGAENSDSRLISIEEVRRRWQKKQDTRRAMLHYTPQPA